MNRETLRGILLAGVVLLVLCAAAELILRARAGSFREGLRASLSPAALCTGPAADPQLIYTYVSGRCETNSAGYPDTEHPVAKPDTTFRVLIIGDSVAEGYGVPREARFATVLDSLLGGGTEVIVMARAGYSTVQEQAILTGDALRFNPDLIVWSYCLNDPAHPVYHNANGNLGRYYYRPRSYLIERIRRAAFYARERWRGRHCPQEYHARVHCIYKEDVSRRIGEIGSTLERAGVPGVFVVHPVFEPEGFGDYSLGNVHAFLTGAAESAGLLPLDLLPALSRYHPDDIKITDPEYYDPWHPNALGHRVTADTLAAFIKETIR